MGGRNQFPGVCLGVVSQWEPLGNLDFFEASSSHSYVLACRSQKEPGASWALLGPPGSSWVLLGPPGFSWVLLGPTGSSWL